jgi:hypothetical protein
MAFLPNLGGGASFPQIYCRPIPQTGKVASDVIYSDHAIFAPEKRGLSQLVVLVDSIAEISTLEGIVGGIKPLSADIEQLVNEAICVAHETPQTSTERRQPSGLVRIATAEEFRESHSRAMTSHHSRNR